MSSVGVARGGGFARLLRGVFAALFDKSALLIVQVLLVPVLASHWGLPLYGVWLLISTVPSYLALSDFGFATAAGNDMTMKTGVGDQDGALVIFQSVWSVVGVLSASIVTLAMAAIWLLPLPDNVFRPMSLEQGRLCLSFMTLYGAASLQNSVVLAGFRSNKLFATGRTGTAVMFIFEGGVAMSVVALGGSPVAVAIAYVICRALGVSAMILLLRRRVPWLRLGVSHASRPEAERLLRPALAAMTLPLSEALFLQGTALAVGIAASPAAAAVFATVRTLSRTGIQFTTLLSHPLMPEFSAARASGNTRATRIMLIAIVAVSVLFVIPGAVLFAFLGKAIVEIWTHHSVSPPQSLITVMACVIAVNGSWLPVSNLLLSANLHHRYSYFYLAFSAGCVGLTFVLARFVGALGGGISILVLDLCMLVVVQGLAARYISSRGDLWRSVPEAVELLRARVSGGGKRNG